ncbi:hypothetical protein PCE1_000057 [Barthelona sp. PCE]
MLDTMIDMDPGDLLDDTFDLNELQSAKKKTSKKPQTASEKAERLFDPDVGVNWLLKYCYSPEKLEKMRPSQVFEYLSKFFSTWAMRFDNRSGKDFPKFAFGIYNLTKAKNPKIRNRLKDVAEMGRFDPEITEAQLEALKQRGYNMEHYDLYHHRNEDDASLVFSDEEFEPFIPNAPFDPVAPLDSSLPMQMPMNTALGVNDDDIDFDIDISKLREPKPEPIDEASIPLFEMEKKRTASQVRRQKSKEQQEELKLISSIVVEDGIGGYNESDGELSSESDIEDFDLIKKKQQRVLEDDDESE